MNNEAFEIRVLDQEAALPPPVKTPVPAGVHIYSISRGGDRLRIYMAPGVQAAILAHAWETPDREVGGVLVGGLYQSSDTEAELFVEIVGSLRAAFTDASVVHLTFTPDTWSRIHADLRARYPEAALVGWYHTHPGHGVFLSGADRFVQNHWFAHNQQLALVVDHLRGEARFFVGSEHAGSSIAKSQPYQWDTTAYRHSITRPRSPAMIAVTSRQPHMSPARAVDGWFEPPPRAAAWAARRARFQPAPAHVRTPPPSTTLRPGVNWAFLYPWLAGLALTGAALVIVAGFAIWIAASLRVTSALMAGQHRPSVSDLTIFLLLTVILYLVLLWLLERLRNG